MHCTGKYFFEYIVMQNDGFIEETETCSIKLRDNNNITQVWLVAF
jgi:hypothetical protein